LITKVLVSAVIILAAVIGEVAPATADPSTFSNLTCSSCAGPVSVTSPAVIDQANDGIHEGFSKGFRAVQQRNLHQSVLGTTPLISYLRRNTIIFASTRNLIP
jgi:hypothetical protein